MLANDAEKTIIIFHVISQEYEYNKLGQKGHEFDKVSRSFYFIGERPSCAK
jgi:hypothetical protein